MTRELLIVGAGPAGVSAALWARSLDLDIVLVDAAELPGGQLHHVHFHPRELPGLLDDDGPAIARRYAQQLAEAGVPVRYGVTARALEAGAAPAVVLADGERVPAQAVLVATGARRRHLEVPGETEFSGRGVFYSGTLERERLAGRAVVVVGGGDGACENAVLLRAAGCEVTLVVRATARARKEFRERVAGYPEILVLERTRVVAVTGDTQVRAVTVAGPNGERELACDGVVVKLGMLPNAEWCRDTLAVDDAGHVRVDARLATSVPGVWAAGDVTGPLRASVAAALGSGALAVAAIRAALRGA